MRQLAGTGTRYRRAHATPLAGLISGRADYNFLPLALLQNSGFGEVRDDLFREFFNALIIRI
jgi:hypothetical protein